MRRRAEREEVERKAALERERLEQIEVEEERKKKREVMKLTEQIEAKAMDVHSKELKLKEKKLLMKDSTQEILEKINVVKADIEYTQKA